MSAKTDFLYTEWCRASEEYTIARGKADRAAYEADLAYARLKFSADMSSVARAICRSVLGDCLKAGRRQ